MCIRDSLKHCSWQPQFFLIHSPYQGYTALQKEAHHKCFCQTEDVYKRQEILKELGTPGSLEFLDSTGYTAFSQGNDYTPLLTGSDVKAAQAYTCLLYTSRCV